ncbi:MAG: hypothetical protein ACI33P_04190 [Lysinibacillus sp.]
MCESFFEMMGARLQCASTIFCAQFPQEGWYAESGQAQIADDMLNCIVHDAHPILIDGQGLMRGRQGLTSILLFSALFCMLVDPR